jgi:hypothetical protein
VIRAATFVGLVLLFPCPWFMIAVGGVLPLPVIVAYGVGGGGVVLAIMLVHVIIYVWVFGEIARWVGRLAGEGPVRPIFGSGENLAAGGKLSHTAYRVYQDAFADRLGGGRR